MLSSLIEKLKQKRQTTGFQKRIILYFIPLLLILLLLSPLPARGYDIIIENNVDADSNEDAVANIGDDGATDYTDAQTLDGTDQTIAEGNTGGAGGITEYIAEMFTDGGGDFANEELAYDGDWGTASQDASFSNADDYPCGYASDFDSANSGTGTITQVDIVVRLQLQSAVASDEIGITLDVGASEGTVLMAMTTAALALNNYTYTDITEPNDASWEWSDVWAIEVHIDGEKVAAGDGDTLDVYEFAVKVTTAGENNYELQWEHQVNTPNPDPFKDRYFLCIYGYSSGGGSENFEIQMWNFGGTQWDTALTTQISTTEQWYNQTIDNAEDYIDTTSNEITWRYRGTNEASDTTQDTLNIDWAGVRAYNVSVYGLDDFDGLEFSPDASEHNHLEFPLQFQVECGGTYDLQIKGVDVTGTPVTSGYIYWNTVNNYGTATQLTTSWVNFKTSQAAGNTTHDLYLWVDVNWNPDDPGMSDGLQEYGVNVTTNNI